MTPDERQHPPIATSSQTVGPFFHVGPTKTNEFGRMVEPDAPGEHISLEVRVLDGEGEPVSDAMIELWQPEVGFGRLGTDNDGWCRFETIRPTCSTDSPQAPHFNVCVFARGLLRHLYTRVYFEGDAAFDRDPVWSAVPEARRSTLLAHRAAGQTWTFVIRLQGQNETAFFDI